MYKIEVAEELHVVLFDANRTLTSQFHFRLGQLELKQSDSTNERQEPVEHQPLQLEFEVLVEEAHTIKCSSQYF